MKSITLTGSDLSHEQLVAVAYGASVVLDPRQLPHVAATSDFLSEQVTQQQPLYGYFHRLWIQCRQTAGRTPYSKCQPQQRLFAG